MTSELIIDAQPKEVTIALLEDQKLVEFQKEGQDSKYSVGNIYACRHSMHVSSMWVMNAKHFCTTKI